MIQDDQDLNKLLGQTLIDIKVKTNNDGEDLINFISSSGDCFRMFHSQSCCEQVTIDEIIGDLSNLIDSPILVAESVSNNKPLPGFPIRNHESYTWTFYKFSTIKGSVTIRWYGCSNGYYSESVSFRQILEDEDL